MHFSVDEQIGRWLRRRRLILGLTQAQLAVKVGVRFQQIHKYECAANKISAAMLWQLSVALEVPVSYFYEGRGECTDLMRGDTLPSNDARPSSAEIETLTQLLGQLKPRVQKGLLNLAKSIQETRAVSVEATTEASALRAAA